MRERVGQKTGITMMAMCVVAIVLGIIAAGTMGSWFMLRRDASWQQENMGQGEVESKNICDGVNKRHGRRSHMAKEFDEVAGCEIDRDSQIHKQRGTFRIWRNGGAWSWSKDVKTMRNNCEEMVGVKDSEVKGNK